MTERNGRLGARFDALHAHLGVSRKVLTCASPAWSATRSWSSAPTHSGPSDSTTSWHPQATHAKCWRSRSTACPLRARPDKPMRQLAESGPRGLLLLRHGPYRRPRSGRPTV